MALVAVARASGLPAAARPRRNTTDRRPTSHRRSTARVAYDLSQAGVSIQRSYDFAFDGGRIEFEMRRDDDRVIEIARNHYAVPLVIAWHLENLDNLSPLEPSVGVVVAARRADAERHRPARSC